MIAENIKSNVPKNDVFLNFLLHDVTGMVSILHYHDELELLQVISGQMCCTVDGVDYKAHAGEVIFVRSGVPHQTSAVSGTQINLIQFRESGFISDEINKIIKYSLKLQNLSEEPVMILNSTDLFSEITEMVKENEKRETSFEIFIRGSIYKIIGILHRLGALSETGNVYDENKTEKILPVLSYVNENYNENISLERASAMLGFEQSYFCRIFKAATVATFTEDLNFVRICKAEKLLAKTSLCILDIALEVGFSSVSYFIRVFKKYKNCSPSHYRRAKYCKNI